MEIKREKLDGPPSDFRARQLTSRDLLRGDLGALHSRKLRSFDEPPFR